MASSSLPKGPIVKIIIPIMGPTGAGKSTFVNVLAGEEKMKVGHQLSSCTSEPTAIEIPKFRIQGLEIEHQLVVLDTPGFDDTNEGDAIILTRIAKWLKEAYKNQTYILGGVLYLHDISQKRFTGTAKKNLTMFNRMCGDVALPSVVLCTTNWPSSNVGQHRAEERRESEFREEHWRAMITMGAQVMRYYRTMESAQAVVTNAVRHMVEQRQPTKSKERQPSLALEIQEELVTQKKVIPETKAAEELRYTLKEVIDMQQKMAKLEKSMVNGGDPEAQARLAELKEKKKKILNQVKQLNVPFSRKLRRLFGIQMTPSR